LPACHGGFGADSHCRLALPAQYIFGCNFCTDCCYLPVVSQVAEELAQDRGKRDKFKAAMAHEEGPKYAQALEQVRQHRA
jgi:hypothetical protein